MMGAGEPLLPRVVLTPEGGLKVPTFTGWGWPFGGWLPPDDFTLPEGGRRIPPIVCGGLLLRGIYPVHLPPEVHWTEVSPPGLFVFVQE